MAAVENVSTKEVEDIKNHFGSQQMALRKDLAFFF